MEADPGRLRQLRRQALAYDDRDGLSLLLAGEAEAADEVVRLGLAIGAAYRNIDVLPRDPGIGEGAANGLLGQIVILSVESTEHRARGSDDVDLVTHARARNP
jgi:hypothetical protein